VIVWHRLGLVMAGGALGTLARAALVQPWTDAGALAVTAVTLIINLLGAFALGLVVGVLGSRHPTARAFLGTGVLGGFTTYSAFAVQTATVGAAAVWVPFALAAVSVVAGVLLAGLGVQAGRAAASRRGGADEPEEAE
jgi:fluoride exporter